MTSKKNKSGPPKVNGPAPATRGKPRGIAEEPPHRPPVTTEYRRFMDATNRPVVPLYWTAATLNGSSQPVIGVYAVPAFYLPQWVPKLLQPFLYVNPFSYFVRMYQDVLYYGDIRHPFAWVVSLGIATLSLAVGVRAFRKLKPYVANVL